jgi:flagellar assembly factor FliW
MSRWTSRLEPCDNQEGSNLKLGTKYFGQVDYEPEDVLSFPDGLFGFEDEKEFLLLPFAGSGESLLCLQSVQTAALAFVVINPFSLCSDYEPELQKEELKALGVTRSHDLGYYTLCAVKNPVSESTVNLQCPVAVNPHTRCARQVILENGRYQMRHPLAQFKVKEGAALC